MSIRSFIAVPVPKSMADALGDIAAQMVYQDKSNAVRWVDQANYHITLAFLGDQNEFDLEQLAERLDEDLPYTGFHFTISHLSPFPESKPKLIAAMLNKTDVLLGAINACGINIEKRKFLPHITLGRYRHTRNQFAGAIPTSIDIEGDVDEVTLYESVLTPNGAEYNPLFRFPLDEFACDEV